MHIVKSDRSNKISASASTTIDEYLMDDGDISGAIAEIHGRYPEKGFVRNEVFKELVYVLSGTGKIEVDGKEFQFSEGDTLLILAGEKYYWEGNFRIFMATTPKFDPKNHKII